MEEKIYGVFQKYTNSWFVIPDKRDYYGGDFFVNKHNDMWALNWQRIIAKALVKSKWKKPEAKIIQLLWKKTLENGKNEEKTCLWVYIQTNPEFGFIEVPGKEKWYFVHSSKKWNAKNWDKVKATLANYNGKKEAIITEVLSSNDEIIEWELKDNGDFWFVFTKKWREDIFISASNYNWAKDGEKVQVQITKTQGRRPEWIIIQKIHPEIHL